jgi:hypothetical protein
MKAAPPHPLAKVKNNRSGWGGKSGGVGRQLMCHVNNVRTVSCVIGIMEANYLLGHNGDALCLL